MPGTADGTGGDGETGIIAPAGVTTGATDATGATGYTLGRIEDIHGFTTGTADAIVSVKSIA